MTESSFYTRLLHLSENWSVSKVDVNEKGGEVEVEIKYLGRQARCPFTKELCDIYDYREKRKWRHLDTMQYKTYLTCQVPRVINSDGKISTVEVPWSDYSERYTHLFSIAVIQLLQMSKNQTKTAAFFGITFDVVNRIMNRAVAHGLAQRDLGQVPAIIALDEKSFKKGHDYATILTDVEQGRVLEVGQGRRKETVETLLDKTFSKEQQQKIEIVVSDMWEAYLNVVKEKLPRAKSVLDRFHLVKYLQEAIDKTRRKEIKTEWELLKYSKYVMLKNQQDLNEKQRQMFAAINGANLRTALVWRAKENFKAMFGQPDLLHAASLLHKWQKEVRTTALEYLLKVSDMFERHFLGVANALCNKASNAIAERINGAIQKLKSIAKGFRKPENFRTAILFHYGKLQLFPSQYSQ